MANRHAVRTMREAMGLTYEDFADKVGVHPTTIWRWESGEVQPSPLALNTLRRVWGEHQRSQQTPATATTSAGVPTSASTPTGSSLPPSDG